LTSASSSSRSATTAIISKCSRARAQGGHRLRSHRRPRGGLRRQQLGGGLGPDRHRFAAYKNARFIRFCNLYNIPVIFMEDTTGFLPGREQEARGIVQAGRAMLDAIVDLRTPRFLLILRNAFGGAYASYNNYPTGADFVLALPTTRGGHGPGGQGIRLQGRAAQDPRTVP
jgi:acetyl-CoA carboxylase carboxyltransferase component